MPRMIVFLLLAFGLSITGCNTGKKPMVRVIERPNFVAQSSTSPAVIGGQTPSPWRPAGTGGINAKGSAPASTTGATATFGPRREPPRLIVPPNLASAAAVTGLKLFDGNGQPLALADVNMAKQPITASVDPTADTQAAQQQWLADNYPALAQAAAAGSSSSDQQTSAANPADQQEPVSSSNVAVGNVDTTQAQAAMPVGPNLPPTQYIAPAYQASSYAAANPSRYGYTFRRRNRNAYWWQTNTPNLQNGAEFQYGAEPYAWRSVQIGGYRFNELVDQRDLVPTVAATRAETSTAAVRSAQGVQADQRAAQSDAGSRANSSIPNR